MTGYDPARVEHAVHSVFSGGRVEDAARAADVPAAQLAEAVERYQAAGRAALEGTTRGWHQVNIFFVDYERAERAFRAYFLPRLRTGGPVGQWWFVRKAPHWRLRCHPAPGATARDVADHIAAILDSSKSCGATAGWHSALYEPEMIAFGGPAGLPLAHALFHTDSEGVLDYAGIYEEGPSGILGAKETSLLTMSLLMRAARLEAGEQGDVWGRVEERRPLPKDVSPQQVSAMTAPMRRLLLTDSRPLLTTGPLTPVRPWVEALRHHGRHLAEAAEASTLSIGKRAILARHILFHWNRMGFSVRQQSIWSRAAREALLGG
ncbi:thiopeptide-type bacteriocin biosynthesis protein [Streptomyces sp. ITFR-16]|uniref:thiopeptide-type bacteriocin biosynthesis protein n=1 Tax=Streptomyces sp. ITFR-16 TaxID=3075198 RepID=UPI00288B68EB|nr:thiopeptide-type bacteriocin biosynthesis protein [Streptomyces sp. ITFR-16]WNI21602.1 thiopeptide-type bacteriocin biosynthesis protein [Streptomyces sp. ITFR-16]